MAVPSMPVKRWNFRKAKWSHYIALTNKLAKTLLPPDSVDVDAAYQDFCDTIKKAVTVLSNLYLPWGKTGQIVHVSSPFSDIAQKTILARHTSEATRGLGMGFSC